MKRRITLIELSSSFPLWRGKLVFGFVLLILGFYTVSCTHQAKEKPKKSLNFNHAEEIQIDTTSIFCIIKNDSNNLVFNEGKNYKLNAKDIQKIESLLISCIDEYNKDHKEISLKKYRRQYVAITDKKGHHIVWLNCFCGFFTKNTKQNVFYVSDGGDCYFQLKIDLTDNKYFEFSVNGYA